MDAAVRRGQLRFNPLNSWPDNANLDKARRLLWPLRKSTENRSRGLTSWCSQAMSRWKTWASRHWDSPAVESMIGNQTWFIGAPRPSSAPTNVTVKRANFVVDWLQPNGPIYVNEVPMESRTSPGRQCDSYNVWPYGHERRRDCSPIAGGHTFGKAHGALKAADCVGADAGGVGIEAQGQGWKNKCSKGHSEDTITSGLEGAWTSNPARWTHDYLTNLYKFEWKQTRSPNGAIQWVPKDESFSGARCTHQRQVSRTHHVHHRPCAQARSAYRKITERWLKNPKFEDAFARAWFKLTHRDMGPRARYIGSDVPKGFSHGKTRFRRSITS